MEKLNDDSLNTNEEELNRILNKSKAISALADNVIELNRLKLDIVKASEDNSLVYTTLNGLVVCNKAGRVFKDVRNARAREYNRHITPEQRAKRNARANEYYKRRRREDPEYIRHIREYKREWAKRKRNEQDY